MFPDPTVVTVDSQPYNYGLVSVQGRQSQRLEPSADIGEPDSLRISHETKGKGAAAVDRHMVRVDTTLENSNPDGSTSSVTVSAYVVLIAPHVIASDADVLLAYNKVATFLGQTESGATLTNVERVLKGEP